MTDTNLPLDAGIHLANADARLHRPTGYHHVHGTPITPAARIADLAPTSFCLSYWNRHDHRPYLSRLDENGVLLLDNGAFSVFMHNLRNPDRQIIPDTDYWTGFYGWAREIMHREPRAMLIIPDSIGGDAATNAEMIGNLPDDIPHDRAIPVWHLHEPLEYLSWLAEQFGTVAFGSSGEFRSPDTVRWRQRVDQALTHLATICTPDTGLCHPRIHMLRGLRPMARGEFAMDSGDSTNLARNHGREARRGIHIASFQARIHTRRYPAAPTPRWPQPSKHPVPTMGTSNLQHDLFMPG